MGSITQKMLAQTLKRLKRDGLVERTVFQAKPITVEYTLTHLGGTLIESVTVLAHWAESNMDTVSAAQTAYDNATVGGAR
ncbi:DNA-binding HxlR family transcriptional regulator [Robbsia andropogonis]|uniref:winged helix-turn-helix transcriptional regulator n=1 Tax=Robbsia andropogonis TaxID=28092 RepID=UPI0006991BC8|nr:helix-turn-helix domain-containing protein [Robbsia andropogonis]MCP1119215.1 helix-turn-helix transcriptional regulator [Robbsia andropogonis]MCP1128934.1 helix-turn-helix transcriptional regulator [Robbsia andropogonis]